MLLYGIIRIYLMESENAHPIYVISRDLFLMIITNKLQ